MHIQGGKLKETPLHLGARVPDGDRCVLMLLKSGANPNIITENGETPVHVASRYGNVVTLDLLLDDQGDPLLKSHVSQFTIVSVHIHSHSFPKNRLVILPCI